MLGIHDKQGMAHRTFLLTDKSQMIPGTRGTNVEVDFLQTHHLKPNERFKFEVKMGNSQTGASQASPENKLKMNEQLLTTTYCDKTSGNHSSPQ